MRDIRWPTEPFHQHPSPLQAAGAGLPCLRGLRQMLEANNHALGRDVGSTSQLSQGRSSSLGRWALLLQEMVPAAACARGASCWHMLASSAEKVASLQVSSWSLDTVLFHTN